MKNKLKSLSSGVGSVFGFVAGAFIIPSYIAPAVRSLVGYLYGPTGLIGSVAKRTLVENSGHLAFKTAGYVAPSVTGPAGYAVGTLAFTCVEKGVTFAYDKYMSSELPGINDLTEAVSVYTPKMNKL